MGCLLLLVPLVAEKSHEQAKQSLEGTGQGVTQVPSRRLPAPKVVVDTHTGILEHQPPRTSTD